jgi:oligosaccharyltransferase complex subunit epsilon
MSTTTKELTGIVGKFLSDYQKSTPTKLRLIDIYLAYVLFTGIIQFVYCCIVGTFPFNAFLAGFISCVASFVLGVNLRLQVNPENKDQFKWTNERAFGDFFFAHVVLHLVVMNFIG